MRTIVAGLRTLRRRPLALLPLVLEALLATVLIQRGALPSEGATAPIGAVFPFDVYFDVKHALAFTAGWEWFVGAMILSILVRSLVLSATLWLAEEGERQAFPLVWLRALKLTAYAVPALLPAATFFFVGVAVRYAPFIWIGAILGFLAAVLLVKRAVRLQVGPAQPRGAGVPDMGTFLAYAYLVTVLAWGMTIVAEDGTRAGAFLLLLAAPVHGLFILGWRRHAREETHPGGGTVALAVTVLVVVPLVAVSVYDRLIRDGEPVGEVEAQGTLLLLGGADSTAESGALTRIDGRDLGFPRDSVVVLSYRGAGEPYEAADTRRDLRAIARALAPQIEDADPPTFLLGHSQASIIADRLLDEGLAAPDAIAVLAPVPAYPPPLEVPPPGREGVGRPAGDVARLLSRGLDFFGMPAFDLDAPSSPTNLEPVVALGQGTRRLSIWALGDSVWLTGDWRRPGEANFVALTDHVGITNNGRALRITSEFFEDGRQPDDTGSWRGRLASVLRFAFEPWRPDR